MTTLIVVGLAALIIAIVFALAIIAKLNQRNSRTYPYSVDHSRALADHILSGKGDRY